jgi:uncharacterized protein (TIGR00725 family)
VVHYVAVIGASRPTERQAELAREVGRLLGEAGAVIITGGGGGVMEAASRGGAEAGATVVGLLPGEDRGHANPWVGVAIPTGLGELRNGLIVRACDAAIAVGGAYGTLSEIALALAQGVPVVGLDTWDIGGIEVAPDPAAAVARGLELAAARLGGSA